MALMNASQPNRCRNTRKNSSLFAVDGATVTHQASNNKDIEHMAGNTHEEEDAEYMNDSAGLNLTSSIQSPRVLAPKPLIESDQSLNRGLTPDSGNIRDDLIQSTESKNSPDTKGLATPMDRINT
jgi:hypothetical protein